MKSKAHLSGHPIHPMLVALAIGLFVWTLVADVVYIVSDNDMTWYDIAFWTSLAAIASAVVAAIPGLVDLMGVARYTDARAIAVVHGSINTVVVLMFGAAALLMIDDGAVEGGQLTAVFVLHALSVGLLGVSGWLGGELVYRHHIGFNPDTRQAEEAETTQHAGRGYRAA